MNTTHFLEELDSRIQKKHLLSHPFYQAWTKGNLSLECLKEYAKEYYHHVDAFPTYLSLLHSRTLDPATRKEILKNLIEEEAGFPNHPDLWRTFANSMGANNAEIDAHKPSQAIQSLIDTFRNICLHDSVAAGLAALYAYESQIPDVCESKIAGLKTHYGLKHPKDWSYFTVHIAADKEHAASERALLEKHVTAENAQGVQAAADKVLDHLWKFLSSLCHRFNIAMEC
jgi:pyrroloquinoline-quinone synthase